MEIRPAATLVLTRDTDAGLEVLLLQRSWDTVFMPGYYVFPGGAVDAGDPGGRAHIIGVSDAEISQIMSLDEGGADYMLAAVRECFEEAGILLAQDAGGRFITAEHPVHGERQALAEGRITLAELCRRHRLILPLDQLAYLSHWVTPPGLSRRYDTRFFVARTPDHQIARHDGEEAIDHVWLRPAQALEDHRKGRRLIGLPTLRTLRLLSDFDNTGALLRHAHAHPPAPHPSQPWPAHRQGRPLLLEPGAPAYDEAVHLDPEGEGSTCAEIIPGEAVRIGAGVVRITAPNGGMMTGPGTNTYLLGHEHFTVVDPGPDDPEHIERILELTGGRIRQILVTHTHIDHSPAARTLKARTGCRLLGWPAPEGPAQDVLFQPDEKPAHNDLIRTEAGDLRVLHTPGHASNHLCYLLVTQGLLFAGDLIMQGSTVVINPPDGDMKAYLDSLYSLLAEPVQLIAPAHGFLMAQPEAVIDFLITHRLSREHKIARVLEALSPVSLKELTARAYDDVPAPLLGLASRSALAHLLKLQAEGRARESGGRWQHTDTGAIDSPI